MVSPIRRSVLFAACAAILAGLILASANWALGFRGYVDFGSFWASGDAANRGLDPYGVYEHTFRVGGPDGPPAPNLNPPVSVYPVRLLATQGIDFAFSLWRLGSIALYVATVLLLVRALRPDRPRLFVLWALALGGFWHTVELGQVYVALLALAAGAWIALARDRPAAAALCLGLLAALKPNFLVWPVLLALGGERRSGVGGLAVFAALSGIPLLIEGPGIYRSWFEATPSLSEAAGGMARIGGNSSLLALGGRFDLAPLGFVLAGVLGVALAVIARLRLVSTLYLSGLAIVGTLLLGPVSWAGYSILLLPVFAGLRWRRTTVIAAAALCLPYWLVLETGAVGTPLRQAAETTYGAALLVMLAGLLAPVVLKLRHSKLVARDRHLKTSTRRLTDAPSA